MLTADHLLPWSLWAMESPVLILFMVIASGLLLGRVRLLGLTLGSSGVIFSALAAGYLGYGIPGGVGTVGLVLFAYGIGITAGPGFFRAFRQQGKKLAILAFGLVVVAAIVTWVVATLLGIPADLAAGLFAGALTSTPGLAAPPVVRPQSGMESHMHSASWVSWSSCR